MTQLTNVADVLEIIAEYACGTVAGAVSLRAVSKEHRRAVDTSVRVLVLRDQPELRASRSVELRLNADAQSLDALRIAFTEDTFPRIFCLAVVAFALDGAKNELREGGVCGPRPVAAGDEEEQLSAYRPFQSSWALSQAFVAATITVDIAPPASLPRCAIALSRCLAEVYLTHEHVTEALCDAVESSGRPWAAVSRLSVSAESERGCRVARLVRAVAPQLTHLRLIGCQSVDVCAAIAHCTRLVEVRFNAEGPLSAAFADSLIASGAPVAYLNSRKMNACDALRVLEAVPTIVNAAVAMGKFPADPTTLKKLPPAVAGRMIEFNFQPGSATELPMAAKVWVRSVGETSSEHATSLSMCGPLPDLRVAFPKLKTLVLSQRRVEQVTAAQDDDDDDPLPLPVTLEEVHLDEVAEATPFLRRLAITQPTLSHLSRLWLPFTNDISSLVPFAGTLTRLEFDSGPGAKFADDEELQRFEAVVAQLHLLEHAQIPFVPTARCFLEGNHTRLREVWVKAVDDVPFFVLLVQKCPRLVVCSNASGMQHPPAGWLVEDEQMLTRTSFANLDVEFDSEAEKF